MKKVLPFFGYFFSIWRGIKKNNSNTKNVFETLKTEKNFFECELEKNFFYPPPPQTEKKRGPLFSFFEIFTAEFSHFLMTKKHFFCHQKVTKLCSENFEKRKKWSPFCFCFFLFGGDKKKIPAYLSFREVKFKRALRTILTNFSKKLLPLSYSGIPK